MNIIEVILPDYFVEEHIAAMDHLLKNLKGLKVLTSICKDSHFLYQIEANEKAEKVLESLVRIGCIEYVW